MEMIINFIQVFLTVYILCVFIWALMSWIPMISPGLAYNSFVISLRKFLDSVVDPYMNLFRGIIKPIHAGGTMIDLSSIVGIIVLIVLQKVVASL
jgi:uncharacterized protein YggT (Ycf19 family)